MENVILFFGPARRVFKLLALKARREPGKTIKELKGETNK